MTPSFINTVILLLIQNDLLTDDSESVAEYWIR